MARGPSILVMRGGGVGDFVLTLPVFTALRDRWPDARIRILGNPRIAALAVSAGLVDSVLPADAAETSKLFIPNARLTGRLADAVLDTDVALVYTYDPDGLVHRNLADGGAGLVVPGQSVNFDRHAADTLSACLAELAIYPESATPDLTALPTPDRPGRVTLHPGSGNPAKNWPLDRFVTLARALLARGRDVRVLTGEAEAGMGPALRNALPSELLYPPVDVVDLARDMGPRDTHVGNDTGVTHLAAARGCRTLALFGPTDPRIWAPRGPGEVRVLRDGVAMGDLSVGRVLDALGEAGA